MCRRTLWQPGTRYSGPTFKERLEADPRCTVSQEKLDEIFDPWDFLTRIDTVFDRLEQLSFE